MTFTSHGWQKIQLVQRVGPLQMLEGEALILVIVHAIFERRGLQPDGTSGIFPLYSERDQ